MLRFDYTASFQKDLKSLSKRWPSLSGDIKSAEDVLRVIYGGDKEIRQSFFELKRIALLKKMGDVEVVKMRIDCKSLGNDKKTRIVFVAEVLDGKITMVELYAKNDKEREDPKRYKNLIDRL